MGLVVGLFFFVMAGEGNISEKKCLLSEKENRYAAFPFNELSKINTTSKSNVGRMRTLGGSGGFVLFPEGENIAILPN